MTPEQEDAAVAEMRRYVIADEGISEERITGILRKLVRRGFTRHPDTKEPCIHIKHDPDAH